jgi:ribonuclease HI
MQLNAGMQIPDRRGKSLAFPVIASGEKKDKVNNGQKWTKPPLGWAKVNTDASFVHANGTAHWGAIVRDDHDNTISSSWNSIPRCASAEEAEAIAVLEGLPLASALDIPCYLETDCKSIIYSWNDNKNWRSQAGIVINEAKQAALSFQNLNWRSQAGIVINEAKQAALSFQNLKIEFNPRTTNSASHRLAAFSGSTGCNGFLYSSVPVCAE